MLVEDLGSVDHPGDEHRRILGVRLVDLDDPIGQAAERTGGGAVLLTSRVSVEMIQKAAVLGAPILVAVSAPTALAVRVAEAAGITLVAVARQDGFEIFSHPDRVLGAELGQPAAAD